jgi:hypothetical protein
MGYRWEEQVRPEYYSRAQLPVRRARLEQFLDEPRADAVSDEEHARRGVRVTVAAVRREEHVEKLEVRLDLSGQRHA